MCTAVDINRNGRKGPYPLGDFGMTNFVANLPVGMAYLLGNWATDRRAIAVAGKLGDRRLISSMFDISLPTNRL